MKNIITALLTFGLLVPVYTRANTYAEDCYEVQGQHRGHPHQYRALADGEVANLLWTANDAEIAQSRVAADKARSEDVKGFAKMMVKEHKHNSWKLQKISDKEGIAITSSKMSEKLEDHAMMKWDEVNSNKGLAFDHAYIDSQVHMHEQILMHLDSKLIPEAKNGKFKEYLEMTREHVATHLRLAKIIQSTFVKHDNDYYASARLDSNYSAGVSCSAYQR